MEVINANVDFDYVLQQASFEMLRYAARELGLEKQSDTLQPAPVLSPEQIDKEIIVNYIRDSGSKITRMKVLRALYDKLNDAFFEWRRKYTEEAREECSENLTRLLVLTHPAYSIYDYALDEVLFYMN